MKKTGLKDDLTILYKIKDGDLNAYRYLFDNYFIDLCKFLRMYVNDQFIAEEIALDIFTNFWERRKELNINNSLKGYLFQSAKYRAISHLRKERNNIITQLNDQETLEVGDDVNIDTLEVEELRKIIDEAIESLPEKSKLIYLMAREENMSHKEIASKLGISPKTVENHVGIALKKLRNNLKPHYEEILILCLALLSK